MQDNHNEHWWNGYQDGINGYEPANPNIPDDRYDYVLSLTKSQYTEYMNGYRTGADIYDSDDAVNEYQYGYTAW